MYWCLIWHVFCEDLRWPGLRFCGSLRWPGLRFFCVVCFFLKREVRLRSLPRVGLSTGRGVFFFFVSVAYLVSGDGFIDAWTNVVEIKRWRTVTKARGGINGATLFSLSFYTWGCFFFGVFRTGWEVFPDAIAHAHTRLLSACPWASPAVVGRLG